MRSSGLAQEAPYADVEHDERSCRLVPGGQVTIGRHARNDLVLRGAEVSRFHATIRWCRGRAAPSVHDDGSRNGTRVDGRLLRGEALEVVRRATIDVCGRIVTLRRHRPGDEALLEDADEVVHLFSEEGPEWEGRYGDGHEVALLLRALERERRTGTLRLREAGGSVAEVGFCLGHVMGARRGEALRTRALEQLIHLSRPGEYHFDTDVEPTSRPLNVSPRRFLARLMPQIRRDPLFAPTLRLKRAALRPRDERGGRGP